MRTLLYFWRRFLAWIRSEPERPAIVWTDANGVGWRARPDYQEPWVPDTGQHEIRKREMRIFLWRLIRKMPHEPFTLDPATLGLGGHPDRVPRLLPMGQELAAVCRRHGFARFARASMPEASEAELLAAWEQQEAAVQTEADRIVAGCAEKARTWDPRQGAPPGEPRENIVANLTCGPWEADGVVDGHERAALKPIVLKAGGV